jgi:hypothetical protein
MLRATPCCFSKPYAYAYAGGVAAGATIASSLVTWASRSRASADGSDTGAMLSGGLGAASSVGSGQSGVKLIFATFSCAT